ncbi:hypothetical protein P9E76_20640 [Schinkia azotoformans]|uniref:HipA-like kinase domain-containing protein n=1 Tax=Schinkia azotoformans LMG 9581 TaxID=1131731 RepID=K6ECG4_SCHAZ|nr:HipA family kinase [Schinkia azotoformans]EKN71131.1 hypothetical protein BAZO_00575 [Schinkia azotoformans LMG 9581]MEC1640342.1 hypothetical protein [Schinkia azotoformans]MEC1722066.1 hypothetical protein [Schinkia azotoformans]MEC1947404.1 hypothetical protein [Schinkia azotoformans]MED4354206.1 hypothetical protein [Schinkia azotoformans]
MIEPVRYQKKLEGKSNAHLITFSDGNDYVVKYFQPGFEKSLPNEWVAYCLARFLELPIPYARIVDIPEEFSNNIKELAGLGSVKYQYASLYKPNCFDGHQVLDVSNLTNDQVQLAGIILFDYWLCNTDRTRKNILLHEVTPNIHGLSIIDHAEVFGTYNWDLPDLENLPTTLLKSATHQIMTLFIEEEENFSEQLEIIQTIPVLLMEEIVDLIPEEWAVSKEEKKAMVSALIRRRKKVLPELTQRFIKKIYHPLKSYD